MDAVTYFNAELKYLDDKYNTPSIISSCRHILNNATPNTRSTLRTLYGLTGRAYDINNNAPLVEFHRISPKDYPHRETLERLNWVELKAVLWVTSRAMWNLPLSAIHGHDDEWVDKDDRYLMNKRYPKLLKNKKTGLTYTHLVTRHAPVEGGMFNAVPVSVNIILPWFVDRVYPQDLYYTDISYRYRTKGETTYKHTDIIHPRDEFFKADVAERIVEFVTEALRRGRWRPALAELLVKIGKNSEYLSTVKVRDMVPPENPWLGSLKVLPVYRWDWIKHTWVLTKYHAIRWVDATIPAKAVYFVCDETDKTCRLVYEHKAFRCKDIIDEFIDKLKKF